MPSYNHNRSLRCRRQTLTLALALTAGMSTPSSANEAGVCVFCTDPEASYLCQIADQPDQVYDARLQLLCIKTLAKQNQHGQCRVERTSSGPCTGKLVSIDVPGNEPVAAPGQDLAQPDESPTDTFANTEQGADANPDNPQVNDQNEESGNIIKSAGKAMTKAGKTIGDTAKKSWNCVTSLFNDC